MVWNQPGVAPARACICAMTAAQCGAARCCGTVNAHKQRNATRCAAANKMRATATHAQRRNVAVRRCALLRLRGTLCSAACAVPLRRRQRRRKREDLIASRAYHSRRQCHASDAATLNTAHANLPLLRHATVAASISVILPTSRYSALMTLPAALLTPQRYYADATLIIRPLMISPLFSLADIADY